MALQKHITLPNAMSGDYIRLGSTRIEDRHCRDREAVAHFFLFADQAAAQSVPNHYIEMIAALKLRGARYDQYFSKPALEAAGWNYDGQFYAALKTADVATGELMPGGELTDLDLTDAQDV